LLLGIGVIAALVVGWQVAAFAVHDTGAFELDGNAVSGTTATPTGPHDDWDRVCHQVDPTACPTGSITTGTGAVSWNAEQNPNSSIFTGGGSKDPQDINNWAWKDGAGGLPDKDNLEHSFAARYPSTSEGDVLYFGSDRFDNSGDAQQGFWFFQNKITQQGTTSGTFNGLHKTGDLLIVSDFSNGGSTSTISVYKWDPTVSGNLKLLQTSSAANCASAAANDQFCGIVNPTQNPLTKAPWPFLDKSGNTNYLNGEFYEGGVNLTKLGLGNECFSSVASETRSSTSTTAVLKDFVLGGFGSCSSGVTTTPKDGNGNAIPAGGLSVGTGSVDATDQATLNVTGTNTWSGSLQFSLCGPLDSAAGCATGGKAIGSAINVSNATTQPISSPKATVTSAGTYCWRADFTSATSGVPNGSDGSTSECFTVNPVTPTLATTAGDDVNLGNPISDTATLTGTANQPGTPVINPTTAGAKAGGTITFTAYGPDDCTTKAFTTSTPVTVNGDGTYGPVSFTLTQPGTYHWVATYSGNSPNTNGTDHNTDCSDANEDVVVTSVPSSMTTAQSFIPNDSSTISVPQGGNLAGSVHFQAYESSDCGASSSDPAIVDQTKTVSGASPQTVSTTNTTVSTTKANISWKVSYTSTNKAQKDIPATCQEKTALSIDNGGTVTSP
jgi:hypothetical protein